MNKFRSFFSYFLLLFSNLLIVSTLNLLGYIPKGIFSKDLPETYHYILKKCQETNLSRVCIFLFSVNSRCSFPKLRLYAFRCIEPTFLLHFLQRIFGLRADQTDSLINGIMILGSTLSSATSSADIKVC